MGAPVIPAPSPICSHSFRAGQKRTKIIPFLAARFLANTVCWCAENWQETQTETVVEKYPPGNWARGCEGVVVHVKQKSLCQKLKHFLKARHERLGTLIDAMEEEKEPKKKHAKQKATAESQR